MILSRAENRAGENPRSQASIADAAILALRPLRRRAGGRFVLGEKRVAIIGQAEQGHCFLPFGTVRLAHGCSSSLWAVRHDGTWRRPFLRKPGSPALSWRLLPL